MELWLKILIRYRYFTQEFITHFHEIFWVSLIEIKCFILYFQESLTEPSFIYGLSTSQVISGSPLLDALGQDKSFSSSRYTYWNYFFGENIYKNQLFNLFCQFFFSWRSREEPGVQRAKKTSWYNALYPSYKSRSEDFKKTFSNLPSGERLIVGKGF